MKSSLKTFVSGLKERLLQKKSLFVFEDETSFGSYAEWFSTEAMMHEIDLFAESYKE